MKKCQQSPRFASGPFQFAALAWPTRLASLARANARRAWVVLTIVLAAALLWPLAASAAENMAPGKAAARGRLPDFDRWWDYDRPAATERKFRDLLPQAEAAGDLSYLLQLHTQIARCQGLQGHFDACHATLDAVEKRLTTATPVARIRYLLERGRALNSANHAGQAKPLFRAAWNAANSAQEVGYAIDAAHMLAIVESDWKGQADWNRKALALAEKDARQQNWLPSILNNLGETYRAGKDYQKALDCFEKQAQWYRDHHRRPDIFNMKDIARMNRLLGRADKALAVIEPIAQDLRSRNQPDGYISAEYGQCLVAVGRAGAAKPFLAEAFRILSKDDYMVKNEPEELQRIKRLAGLGD